MIAIPLVGAAVGALSAHYVTKDSTATLLGAGIGANIAARFLPNSTTPAQKAVGTLGVVVLFAAPLAGATVLSKQLGGFENGLAAGLLIDAHLRAIAR